MRVPPLSFLLPILLDLGGTAETTELMDQVSAGDGKSQLNISTTKTHNMLLAGLIEREMSSRNYVLQCCGQDPHNLPHKEHLINHISVFVRAI